MNTLLPLLEQPPEMTWALHIALLEGAMKLDLSPPGLEMLRKTDNVHVQAALNA